jgi:hypothetical protein
VITALLYTTHVEAAVYHDEDLPLPENQYSQFTTGENSSKFEEMTWEEVQEDLRSVLPVLYEVNLEGNIGNKLQNALPLSTFEKSLLVWMAQRYKLNATPRITSTLEKNKLRSNDYVFLLQQFKKVLRFQRTLISRHIELRLWLHNVITVINAAEPDTDYDDWLKQNLQKISSMKALEKAMVQYARDLGVRM